MSDTTNNQTSSSVDLQVLNNVDHADLKVITRRGAEFGDMTMHTLVLPFEFRDVQTCYPILFQADAAGQMYPLALFGFEENENLFLKDGLWRAPYIPAMIRRGPFAVGLKDATNEAGERVQTRLLSVDMNHPRISRHEGEPLFKPLGGRSEFLDEHATLLENLHDGMEHCKGFANALAELGLLESVTLQITLNDGSANQLIGFSSINEEKVQELPGGTLEDLSRQGYLLPLFMVIASTSNMRTLIDFKNESL